MSAEARLSELLLQWEERAGQGPPPTPEELCADCPELAPELRRRIAVLRQLDALFGTPGASAPGTPPGSGDVPGDLDEEVAVGGRYRPVRFHARGGLGEVFVARDEELHREVALKRMETGRRHDPDSRRRFLREAELTAHLEHPGVVPVHGLVEGADGQPCYAMRFIQGETLHDALRRFHHDGRKPGLDAGERRLALRQLLGRFVAVCNTIAYAHSRRVLHRDLKPTNVMLGPYGETLVVDWGLAKPLGQVDEDPLAPPEPSSPAGPEDTAPGQALGTPAYMSPEQAAGAWDQVGPASDVYSLGATLYTLLTGQAPAAAVPGRPGVVVAPRQLNPQVPPALEAICRKALAPTPAERYPSAQALADDVERWLADEPVAAYRERLPARLARWGRHHRTWVASGAVLVASAMLALVVGTLLLAQANRRTRAEREKAQQAEATAQAINRFLNEDLLAVGRPGVLGREVTIRQALDAVVPKIEQAFSGQPEVEASVRQTVGGTYYSLGLFAEAEPHLRRAVELQRELSGAEHANTLAAINLLALVWDAQGKWTEAERLFLQTLDASRRVWGPEHAETLAVENNLARVLASQGRFPEAEALFRQTLATHQRVRGPEEVGALAVVNNLAVLLQSRGRHDEAERLARPNLDALRRVRGAEAPQTLAGVLVLAESLRSLGKPADAAALLRQHLDTFRRVQGPQHPETLKAVDLLGLALLDLAKPEEAEPIFRENLDASRQTLGPDHPDTLTTANNLAGALRDLGKWPEAEDLFRQNLAASRRALGPTHLDTLRADQNLAWVLCRQGKLDEAEAGFRENLRLRRQAHPDHPDTLLAVNNLAVILQQRGKPKDAEPLLRESLKAVRRRLGADHPQTLNLEYNLAVLLHALGKPGDAEPLLRKSLAAFRAGRGPTHPDTLQTQNELARVVWAQDRLTEAEPLLREVLTGRRQALPAGHTDLAATLVELGALLTATARPKEAEPLLREGLAIRRRLSERSVPTAIAQSVLGGCLTDLGRYEEAEPLLRSAYETLQADPPTAALHGRKALDRLIRLYEAWDKPAEAAAWRAKRDPPAKAPEKPGSE